MRRTRKFAIEDMQTRCMTNPITGERQFDSSYYPGLNIYMAYTGHPDDEPNHTMMIDDVRNAFCDCEQISPGGIEQYTTCANYYGNRCSNHYYEIKDPGLDPTGNGWIYLKRKETEDRGTVPREFLRMYTPTISGVCPEELWGCDEDDYIDYYESYTGFGWDNIYGSNPAGQGQPFEWSWYEEEEFLNNTELCSSSSCSINYRLYVHPVYDGINDHQAFFYPPWDIASANAECADVSEHHPWDDTPIDQPTSPGLDERIRRLFEATLGEEIAIKYYTIERPHIPLPWAYDSLNDDSLTAGIAIVGIHPQAGRISSFYESRFTNPLDILDTVDFSSALEPFEVAQAESEGAASAIKRKIWVFGGMDAAGFRNDLWFGEPLEEPVGSDNYVYNWTKVEGDPYMTGAYVPSPRRNSAMFFNPDTAQVVVFGGQGIQGSLTDLSYFDKTSLTWILGLASGDVPENITNFSFTQGIMYKKPAPGEIHYSAVPVPFGFIWGGQLPTGAFSNTLYMLNLNTGRFYSYNFNEGAPPGMVNASLTYDGRTQSLYLFGGNDGSDYHNWLWRFSLRTLSWEQKNSDCSNGVCPYIVTSSAIYTNLGNNAITVFPGTDIDSEPEAYSESYFVRRGEEWIASSEKEPDALKGDCDGDTVREPFWSTSCSLSDDWWNSPGRVACDTISDGQVCQQVISEPTEVFTHRIPGLKSFKPRNDVGFVGKGSKLTSYNISDSGSPSRLDQICVRGLVQNIDFYKQKIVVARSHGIVIVDAANPASMSIERQVITLGNTISVKVVAYIPRLAMAVFRN